jgi:hypothetical protein
MSCHEMHPIQDLVLEGFSYVLQIGMHFICTPMWAKFYSCKNVGVTQSELGWSKGKQIIRLLLHKQEAER